MTELARTRFGVAPSMSAANTPEEALAGARTLGGVAVLGLQPGGVWPARLLADPSLRVFASVPCLSIWGANAALAVAQVAIEPTGADETYWTTDAPGPAGPIEDALSRDGVAARLISEGSGVKLFALAGYYQPDDARLARAPGRLSGVIGAAPLPFDVS